MANRSQNLSKWKAASAATGPRLAAATELAKKRKATLLLVAKLDQFSRDVLKAVKRKTQSSAASRLAARRAVRSQPISTRAALRSRLVVNKFRCGCVASAVASASLFLPPNRPSTPGVVLLGVKIVPSTGILRRAADPDRVTPPACREDR